MPKRNATSELDKIVQAQIRNAQMKKSVVVAPSDPTGGQKLPRKQENAARQKVDGDTQYPAIFDREAEASNDQLDEWLEDTQDTIDSPDDFVEDAREDDVPEDPDDESWEDEGPEVYDPYGDDDDLDDDEIESLDLPEDDHEYVTVKKHKRRKMRKANEDDDFADESDDDDLDEHEDDDDDDDDEKEKSKKERRRKEVKKAMGTDAMKYVDGSEIIKSLVDAVWDMRDDMRAEVRQLRLENKRLHKRVETLMQRGNKELAKSLTNGQLAIAGLAPVEETRQPAQTMRKGYGQAPQTSRPNLGAPITDINKAMDTLEKAWSEGGDPSLDKAVTLLELYGASAITSISQEAQDVLRKAGILH